MKTMFRIVAVALTMAVFCSCQPSAEELAKEYSVLTKELAQAKIAGDEDAVERIKDEMEDVSEKLEKAAKREARKTQKKIKRSAKKLGNDIEDAFDDLVK